MSNLIIPWVGYIQPKVLFFKGFFSLLKHRQEKKVNIAQDLCESRSMLLMIISLVDWCIKEGTKRQFNYAKYGIILSVRGWGNVHWGDSKVYLNLVQKFLYLVLTPIQIWFDWNIFWTSGVFQNSTEKLSVIPKLGTQYLTSRILNF